MLYFIPGVSDTFEVLANEKESGQPVIVYSCKQQSKAILSMVDLLTSNHDENKRRLLQALLKKLDMKCVSQEIPSLTPAFLFASKKVNLRSYDCLLYYMYMRVDLTLPYT